MGIKKIISSILAASLALSCVTFVSAEESEVNTGVVSGNAATIKESSGYGYTSISELSSAENVQIITLNNATEIDISNHTDRYTVKYADSDDADSALTLEPGNRIKTDKLYVEFNDECKDTLFIHNYTDDKIDGSIGVTVECNYVDDRDKVTLRSIRLNNRVIDGFDKDITQYTYTSTEGRLPTVSCEIGAPSDSYEVLSNKNVIYIAVFNRNKSKSTVYQINVNYTLSGELKIKLGDNRETGRFTEMHCMVGDTDVSDIANVTIESDGEHTYGVVYSDKVYFMYPGTFKLKATVGNLEAEETVTTTGNIDYDIPDYTFNLSDVSEMVVGDIVTARYSSGIFDDDPRVSLESSNSGVIVAGNKMLATRKCDTKISAKHLNRGDVLKDKSVRCILEKEVKCSEVSVDTNNINIRPGDREVFTISNENVFDTTKEIKVTSGGQYVRVDGNVVTGMSIGKATVEVKCGDAVTSFDVNVISPELVVPTEMIYTVAEKVYVGYENELKVSFNPEGATVSGDDVNLVPNTSGVKIGKKDEFTFTFKPSTIGEISLTLKCDKYNLSQEIKLNAIDGGYTDKIEVTKIVLENASISIEEGNSKRINVKSVLPDDATDKSVKFESTDTRIAEVDSNGRVTANKRGSAKINVYSVSNPTVYATCYVNVYRDSDDGYNTSDNNYRYPVDRVEIRIEDKNGSEKTIRNGKVEVMTNSEQKFIARIYPYNATNQEVRWYTSDDNIAEVDDDGTLTTYRTGEVTLNVVTRDGNHRDSVKVKVTEWSQKPTKITIVNDDNSTINTNVHTGDKLSLKVNFEPLLTTERNVVWTITEGHGIFTVDSMGNVQFNDVGKATIKVYAKDYSVYDTVTFNVTYSEDYWSTIGEDKGVSPKRAILIKFSEPLNKSSVLNGDIFVAKDSSGNEKVDSTSLELTEDGSVLRVVSTTGLWENDTQYYVFIRANCVNNRGIKLNKNCRYAFKTRAVHDYTNSN